MLLSVSVYWSLERMLHPNPKSSCARLATTPFWSAHLTTRTAVREGGLLPASALAGAGAGGGVSADVTPPCEPFLSALLLLHTVPPNTRRPTRNLGSLVGARRVQVAAGWGNVGWGPRKWEQSCSCWSDCMVTAWPEEKDSVKEQPCSPGWPPSCTLPLGSFHPAPLLSQPICPAYQPICNF